MTSVPRWLLLPGFLVGVAALGLPTAGSVPRPQSGGTASSAGDTVVFAGYREQRPGLTHHITVKDLPRPYASRSVDHGADMIERPKDAWPQAPPGFKVTLFATGLENPRLVRRAPNGDLFVAESQAGRIRILRGTDTDGRVQSTHVFASGLRKPFGIAFYPPGPNPRFVYVGNTDAIVRFPYQNGDLQARGTAQQIAELPGGGRLRGGGHWTRDLAFSLDGRRLFASVGSFSNDDDTDDNPRERDRADILEFTPEGQRVKVYAWGIRNAVGIAVEPASGQLWASVNERDELGDNLVPDYITHVQEGGFYGWPWLYMGGHQDPRHPGKHPELKDKVVVPDVLLQPHVASLEMTFYDGRQFPREYDGTIFAAEHGSWNRSQRAGYEVVQVPLKDGRATGDYKDFVTGFVTADGHVWGRPVGIAIAEDGALIVTDDGSDSVWRVSYSPSR